MILSLFRTDTHAFRATDIIRILGCIDRGLQYVVLDNSSRVLEGLHVGKGCLEALPKFPRFQSALKGCSGFALPQTGQSSDGFDRGKSEGIIVC